MIELLRTNDPVLISFATSLLADAGIDHTVADAHMSVIDGSIGALPRRIMVVDDRLTEAQGLLADAGISA
jgi:Putative prokaryotic signal transducing protein